jgi:catechol-2,3-dioxygenase
MARCVPWSVTWRSGRSASRRRAADGNDLELAWDRPVAEWPRDAQGHVAMAMDAELDLDALIADAPPRD